MIEARAELIDYPRAVGMDDESFRTIQTMGLVDAIAQHTVPQHIVRLVNGKGQVLVTNNPRTDEFGGPRKHGFMQQLVDQELLADVRRFKSVDVHFDHELVQLDAQLGQVRAVTQSTSGDGAPLTREFRARYLVGCEGGRSFTREWMAVDSRRIGPIRGPLPFLPPNPRVHRRFRGDDRDWALSHNHAGASWHETLDVQ
ncbi:MAG: FAD-dependent monooxygenase [Streptosporangiaceae bacterium]